MKMTFLLSVCYGFTVANATVAPSQSLYVWLQNVVISCEDGLELRGMSVTSLTLTCAYDNTWGIDVENLQCATPG